MLKTKAASGRTRSQASRRPARPRTRRTTLSLPTDLLDKVEHLAATRHQTISAAVACLVEAALRSEPESPKNSRGIVSMWQKAFAPLTEEERLLVSGIVMDEPLDSRND